MTDLSMPFTEMTREQFQAHLDERSVNTHDGAAVASWFAEDGVQLQVSTGQAATGREAIRARMDAIFQAFPDFHVEVRDLFSTGDHMCVECTLTGTHTGEWHGIPPTGRTFRVDTCLAFRIGPTGLVREEAAYGDSSTMLRQLGLLPGG
jgi:steroid delta-isomerase-like uncharacterized protein